MRRIESLSVKWNGPSGTTFALVSVSAEAELKCRLSDTGRDMRFDGYRVPVDEKAETVIREVKGEWKSEYRRRERGSNRRKKQVGEN